MAALSAVTGASSVDINVTTEEQASQIAKLETVMDGLFQQMQIADESIIELSGNLKGSAVQEMLKSYEENRNNISECLRKLAVIDENLISYINSMNIHVSEYAEGAQSGSLQMN